MKKIVPFKKDIIFKTNLAEITSISLEHTLSVEDDNMIKGEFVVSGEYKMLETSVNTDTFSYTLPFVVDMDERYILNEAIIDVDDFYYEIVNDNVLSVNIDVLIDKIGEKPIEEDILEEKELVRTELPLEESEECIMEKKEELEQKEENMENEKRCIEAEDVTNIFESVQETETYKSYTVYIVRENDTIENIMTLYGVTKEDLEMYNDLSEIKIGDKIIIPAQ